MQIDFHHAVTYVAARLAGFGHREADVIAHCAQYVDDATNNGVIQFDNGALFDHVASAHKALDYSNFDELADHYVWIPFHFLPGNGGKKAGENPEGSFIEKIVCYPGSYVAEDMLRSCIAEKDQMYGLHRLGITMHVLADTWAHQDFAGVRNERNNISALDDNDKPDPNFISRLKDYFEDKVDEIAGGFVGDVFPLGHGAALSYPDLPYLKWSYKNRKGKKMTRDNPTEFQAAANAMCKAMQKYRIGDYNISPPGLSDHDLESIKSFFLEFKDKDGNERHKKWLNLIEEGRFSFPPAKLEYCAKGKGSWKHQAIGTEKDKDDHNEKFPYHRSFLSSDWKMFHDALQAHRFEIIHNILPRYGVCAA